MFDRPIEVLRYRDSRDEYGDRSKELVPVASLVAQRTESGGRENLYAGRLVHARSPTPFATAPASKPGC